MAATLTLKRVLSKTTPTAFARFGDLSSPTTLHSSRIVSSSRTFASSPSGENAKHGVASANDPFLQRAPLDFMYAGASTYKGLLQKDDILVTAITSLQFPVLALLLKGLFLN